MNEITCPHCNASISAAATFCPECGKKPTAPVRLPLKTTSVLAILAIGAAFFFFSWFTQGSISGTKPTKTHDQMAAKQPHPPTTGQQPPPMTMDQIKVESAVLAPLRQATEQDPESLDAWKALNNAVLEEMKKAPPENRQGLTIEYIQTLSRIRKLDPEDRAALLTLADISFQRGVFDKAAEMYETYLKLEPDDAKIKAKLASTYTFTGKYEESEQLLQGLIEEDPANFQAHAYLSITYAQKGDTEKAIAQGEIALKHSPSSEATARFGAFLEKLKSEDVQEQEGNSEQSGAQ